MSSFHSTELDHRLQTAWCAFSKFRTELCGREYHIQDKLRLFQAVITSTALYATATWTLTLEMENRLRTTWRRMMRKLFRTHSWRRKDSQGQLEPWHVWIQRSTRRIELQLENYDIEDWVIMHRQRKWRFAGSSARRSDERWTNALLYWSAPRELGRSTGRPVTRWSDGIVAVAGGNWCEIAKDEET